MTVKLQHIDSCIIGFWRMGADAEQIFIVMAEYVDFFPDPYYIYYVKHVINSYKP